MADKKARTFFLGALTGAVAGAVTALLFAPKPGKELRRDVADAAHKVGDKTTDLGRQAGRRVQQIARKTSGIAVEAKQAAGRLVTDIRSRYAGKTDGQEDIAAVSEAEESRDDESAV